MNVRWARFPRSARSCLARPWAVCFKAPEFHFYKLHREAFLARYRARSNAESTFSAIKRKFGDSVKAKNDRSMRNEVLAKIVCHNLSCLIHAMEEFGVAAEFVCTKSQALHNNAIRIEDKCAKPRSGFQSPGRPGLDISGDGRGDNAISGSFTVLELSLNSNGTVPSKSLLLNSFRTTSKIQSGGTKAEFDLIRTCRLPKCPCPSPPRFYCSGC
jgi:hypothetical protein